MEIVSQFIPFIFLGGIMYFLIIRPQQNEAKKHKEMLAELKAGDKVVTNGGFIVDIKKVEEKFYTVKMNSDATAKIIKESISRKYEDEA